MKKYLSMLLALLMVLSLCACGASDSSYPESSAAYDYKDAGDEVYAAETEVAAAPGGFAANGAAEDGSVAGGELPEVNPDKIIYSADATVETTDFDGSIGELNKLIAEYGGWVESNSVNGANYYNKSRGYVSNRSASYTIRIPSEKFSTVMSTLSTLGNVPYTHTYTQNVTAQYYDTQARMNAYKVQEEKLIEMLSMAQSVEDIIAIEDKLSDVRYAIDSLQSTLNNWDRKVSYSTLYLDINEVQVYTPKTVTKITYGQRLRNAFTGALSSTGEFFKDLLVFIVSIIPAAVIIAALFFLLRPLIKKHIPAWREKSRDRKSAKAAKKAEKALKKAAKGENAADSGND